MEYTLPEHEYKDLKEDQRTLRALQAAGVDNWEGYDYAMETMKILGDDND